jgi:hypothetical protein
MKYLSNYTHLKMEITKYMTAEIIDFFSKLKKVLDTSTIAYKPIDLITVSLLFGFPFNLCKKIDNVHYYISLYTPSLDNTYTITSFYAKKYVPSTIISDMYLENYIFFLKTNIEDNSISGLHYVTPEIMAILAEGLEIAAADISTHTKTVLTNPKLTPTDHSNFSQILLSVNSVLKSAYNDMVLAYDPSMRELNGNIIKLS